MNASYQALGLFIHSLPDGAVMPEMDTAAFHQKRYIDMKMVWALLETWHAAMKTIEPGNTALSELRAKDI